MNWDNKRLVLFLDGTFGCHLVWRYDGACMNGQPTAYVRRDGRMCWVKPGASVEFVEVEDNHV